MTSEPQVIESAVKALDKYGCGSCGPRGFYGTLDIHLEFEKKLADFLGTEGSCVYSSQYTTATSVIPAFAQRQDLLVCDIGANHALKGGCSLARSQLFYFAHNDLEDLERVLSDIIKKDRKTGRKITRRWIIVESIYTDSGFVLNLPELVRIARQYFFRIMLDESNALGVMGKRGRGSWEHFGYEKPTDCADIIIGDLGRALAGSSGFCTGPINTVEHQRLNGSGYVFSASLPPFLNASGIASLDLLSQDASVVDELRENCVYFRKALRKSSLLSSNGKDASHPPFVVRPDLSTEINDISPIVHLTIEEPLTDVESAAHSNDTGAVQRTRLENEKYLQSIVDKAFQAGIALTRAKYSEHRWDNKYSMPPPSLRIAMSAKITKQDIDELIETLQDIVSTLPYDKDESFQYESTPITASGSSTKAASSNDY
eukprot:CAMPEP_0201552488 /NCGR_PEP_ID=MMETSP0173_2-20130828/16749_1 /ASSEMBLY_ACC=CAM_ASM_000268 /TAXON_ID=218659 /ORGANISM="Vexillifera sp., Strain DIVA3 564/2" /LENGTH=428 /DNA_ID=CAMNT_0047962985 /DNA_START=364 /DNA_END=1650 /DNA_ORIENTATION=-